MSEPVLAVDGLGFMHERRRLLDDVSFTLAPGTTLAVCGGNGAGKTLLMRLLAGLERPTEGRVRLATTTPGAGRAGGMGFVFQQGGLIADLTIAENIALPLLTARLARDVLAARLEHNLISFGLDPWRTAFPATVSSGLHKRAQLARAMMLEPPLLLCDSPFDGLDDAFAETMRGFLTRLVATRRIAVLLTDQNPARAGRVADRVLRLENGRLVD